MERMTRKGWRRGLEGILLVMTLLMCAGCEILFPASGKSAAFVFAIDSKNGRVFEIDAATKQAASVPLVNIGQNSTGEMRILGSNAFIAVGSYNNDSPGLYWFDLNAATPVAVRVGEKISAQYLCIISKTKAYVTSADYFGGYQNAVFPFNPSAPAAGLGTPVQGFDSDFYPQDIAWVEDGHGSGRVFVADNKNAKIYKLSADGSQVDTVFSAHAQGTTGLLPGSYDVDGDGERERGIFVASSGGYDASWHSLPGTIDFIPLDASSETAIYEIEPGLSASRLAWLDDDHLIATNYGATWIIDLRVAAGSDGRRKEIKTAQGLSFGSSDVDVYQGVAYVPDGGLTVYCFDLTGIVTAIATGTTGDMITNCAIRE